MMTNAINQRGAALITALVFLVIITLISVTAMRSSTMELRMASNEQEHRLSVQSVQSANDLVLAANSISISSAGDVYCFGFGYTPSCTATGTGSVQNMDVGVSAGVDEDNFVRVTIHETSPCPRSLSITAVGEGSQYDDGSGSQGNCAFFSLESSYDKTDKRGARTETREGYIRLVQNN
jgi:type IV pilus assembly protein PilX